jgi:hypothetical protein
MHLQVTASVVTQVAGSIPREINSRTAVTDLLHLAVGYERRRMQCEESAMVALSAIAKIPQRVEGCNLVMVKTG